MLHTTRGIVLRTIRYNDKSVIATIYTELFGLQGYLIQTGKTKKAALLQPLTCLEITVQHKANATLQRIKEVQCLPQFVDIPYDTSKSALAIFIAEVVYRSVKEEESNLALFGFLHKSAVLLDEEQNPCSNFHLVFMMQFARFLGFFPGNDYSEMNCFFDLQEGMFMPHRPEHPHFVSHETAQALYLLMHATLAGQSALQVNKTQRRELLSALLFYFRLHLQGMSEVRSHRVLEEVMS